MNSKNSSNLPTKAQLFDYIDAQPHPISRRELARAFRIKGEDRVTLKILLKDLKSSHLIQRQKGGWTSKKEKSPPSYAEPSKASQVILGSFQKVGSKGWFFPSDKRLPERLPVSSESFENIRTGSLVLARLEKKLKSYGKQYQAIFLKSVGHIDDSHALSSIALYEREIPHTFSEEALEIAKNSARNNPVIFLHRNNRSQGSKQETEKVKQNLDFDQHIINTQSSENVDLREIPLVTIDDETARDFDDAVWAQETTEGWHAIVAIADVSYYVPPGSALDQEAYERGNSVYFPDQVIPMLPEILSNDICSLRPHKDRACLAVHLSISRSGSLENFKFVRGVMRSHARLTYTQVHKIYQDPKSSEENLKRIIMSLYGVYKALEKARKHRGTLDLDRAERKIIVSSSGKLQEVSIRSRYDSHRLIEELMIIANVAAAHVLAEKNLAGLYRVHDKPDPLKIYALQRLCRDLNFLFPQSDPVSQKRLTHLIKDSKGTAYEHLINNLVLQAQSQAQYSPSNIGHYGLNLPRYCHFTSPIRRYSDLVVHRILTKALGLDSQIDYKKIKLTEIAKMGEHLSVTERRASLAERTTNDRFLALFLKDSLNNTFKVRITGVQRFGLFVTIEEYGANGILPKRFLPKDHYIFHESQYALHGRRTRAKFKLGEEIHAILQEVNPITGELLFVYYQENMKHKN